MVHPRKETNIRKQVLPDLRLTILVKLRVSTPVDSNYRNVLQQDEVQR
jgi:hypothetical protein